MPPYTAQGVLVDACSRGFLGRAEADVCLAITGMACVDLRCLVLESLRLTGMTLACDFLKGFASGGEGADGGEDGGAGAASFAQESQMAMPLFGTTRPSSRSLAPIRRPHRLQKYNSMLTSPEDGRVPSNKTRPVPYITRAHHKGSPNYPNN